jgi:hypothetical protein
VRKIFEKTKKKKKRLDIKKNIQSKGRINTGKLC